MLSEEQIIQMAYVTYGYRFGPGAQLDRLVNFVRAIEREAHKQGQKAMRERAANQAAEEAGEHGTDSDGWYICKSLSHQIEELEIEELR